MQGLISHRPSRCRKCTLAPLPSSVQFCLPKAPTLTSLFYSVCSFYRVSDTSLRVTFFPLSLELCEHSCKMVACSFRGWDFQESAVTATSMLSFCDGDLYTLACASRGNPVHIKRQCADDLKSEDAGVSEAQPWASPVRVPGIVCVVFSASLTQTPMNNNNRWCMLLKSKVLNNLICSNR